MPWWILTAAIVIAFFLAASTVAEWLADRHRRRYFEPYLADAKAAEHTAENDRS